MRSAFLVSVSDARPRPNVAKTAPQATSGGPPSRRPSKDFKVALNRRLSLDSPTPAKQEPPPKRPSKDFTVSVKRRLSRSVAVDTPNVAAEVPDAFGRKPANRKKSTDVGDSPTAPPIRGMRPRDELIYDEDKETAREYRRAVFDFDYWANSRTTPRYFFNILSLGRSRILRSVLPPTLFVTAIAAWNVSDLSAALTLLNLPALHLPDWSQYLAYSVDPAPLTLTGSSLSLLLVFRTNSSYQRFDEARKMWGLMLNRTRDVVREAIAFYPEGDVHAKATFARWTIAFTVALKCHLRPREAVIEQVQDLLTPAELKLLKGADHKVLLCLQVMSDLIEDASISEAQKLQMQREITVFEDILGGCERLLRTPIPLSYTRHSARFLLIWLAFLPSLLVAKLGVSVIPVTAFVAMLLLGIEEIGVEIEEPFGILPLEVISNKSRQDVTELINKQGNIRQFAVLEYEYDDDHPVFKHQ